MSKFTKEHDWFSHNIGPLTTVLAKFKGTEHIRALEVGCYEGRATCWFLDNILTAGSSSITCVDTWKGGQEHAGIDFDKVFANFTVNTLPHTYRVRVLKGESRVALRKAVSDVLAFAYIDGSHIAANVLEDAILTWPLIEKGGIVFFDDYEWPGTDGIRLHRPKAGIDSFLDCFAEQLQVVHRGYSLAVEKL